MNFFSRAGIFFPRAGICAVAGYVFGQLTLKTILLRSRSVGGYVFGQLILKTILVESAPAPQSLADLTSINLENGEYDWINLENGEYDWINLEGSI